MKGFLVVTATLFSLIGLTLGSTNGMLSVHHHHKPIKKEYNVATVSDIKYESFDAKGNKVTSGTLTFKTKYLDTSDSRVS